MNSVSCYLNVILVYFRRCWVISRPLPKATVSQQSGNGLRNCRWVYWLILVIWIYSATFSSLPFFGIGKYVPEGYLTSCSFDYLSDDPTTHSFVIIIFICFWVVPITIIIVSYVLIVRYVRRAMRDMPVRRHSQHQDNDGFDSEDQLHQRQRTSTYIILHHAYTIWWKWCWNFVVWKLKHNIFSRWGERWVHGRWNVCSLGCLGFLIFYIRMVSMSNNCVFLPVVGGGNAFRRTVFFTWYYFRAMLYNVFSTFIQKYSILFYKSNIVLRLRSAVLFELYIT